MVSRLVDFSEDFFILYLFLLLSVCYFLVEGMLSWED